MDEVNHPIPQFYMFNLGFASARRAGPEINQTRPDADNGRWIRPPAVFLFLIRRVRAAQLAALSDAG